MLGTVSRLRRLRRRLIAISIILIFPTSQHTAQKEARDSERPSPSPQLPTHEKARDSEKSPPGPQRPTHDEAQDSAGKPSLGLQPPTHEEVNDSLDRPSHSSQPPTHEQEQHAPVKGPPIAKRKARVNRQRDKRERMKQEKQEKRRLENERRLEGQRLEYERKLEARRKAEEAAAAARSQSEGEERSTNGGEIPQRFSGSDDALRVRQRGQQQQSLMEESVKAECREDAERGSPKVAIKMDDDQKVHNDDAETVGAPGPRVLEHDTGATCLAITNDKHSESLLIMMAHVSYSFLSIVRLGIRW